MYGNILKNINTNLIVQSYSNIFMRQRNFLLKLKVLLKLEQTSFFY